PARRGGRKPGGGEEIEDERRTGRCVAAINLDGVGEQRRAQIAMRWAWTVGRRYIVRRDVQHRRADVLFEGAEQRRVQQLGEGRGKRDAGRLRHVLRDLGETDELPPALLLQHETADCVGSSSLPCATWLPSRARARPSVVSG